MKTKNSGVVLLLGALSFAASMTVMAGSIESDPIDFPITGEELMFTMDVPSAPAQQTPIVLAQAATPATPPNYILKDCIEANVNQTSDSHPSQGWSGVDPVESMGSDSIDSQKQLGRRV